MNKFFIVVLAICLVSVHGFVKRDTAAPATGEDFVANFKKQAEAFSQQFNSEIGKNLNAEQLKKGFNEFIDTLSKNLNEFKAKTEEAAKN